MKDHFEKELKVGQTVIRAFQMGSSRIYYKKTTIKGFTDKMVILEEGQRVKPRNLVVTREVL